MELNSQGSFYHPDRVRLGCCAAFLVFFFLVVVFWWVFFGGGRGCGAVVVGVFNGGRDTV